MAVLRPSTAPPVSAAENRTGTGYHRAEATNHPELEIGSQQLTTMPDGNQLPTTFKGRLNDVSELPRHGAQTSDMWGIGHNLWVLTAPVGAYKVGWVDPPAGEEPEVRRASRVDSVQVRRAKLVVPRAELVQLAD